MSAHTSIQENLHGSSSNISTDNRQRGIGYTEHPNLQVKISRLNRHRHTDKKINLFRWPVNQNSIDH